MYSEKLKTLKVHTTTAGATYGIGVTKDQLRKMIENFCNKEDCIGVIHSELFDLFDEYCRENGYPMINRQTLGRCFCDTFNLTRKRTRIGDKLYVVYAAKVE